MSNQANPVPDTVAPVCAIIKRIESNGNYGALRFERKVFNRITDQGYTPIISAIQKANNCSSDTARVIYSMSFGAYQMMGFNLYGDLKISVSIADYLKDYCLQDETFYQFIQLKGIVYTVDELKNDSAKRDHFALTYNGSTRYADNIALAIKGLNL